MKRVVVSCTYRTIHESSNSTDKGSRSFRKNIKLRKLLRIRNRLINICELGVPPIGCVNIL